MIIINRFPPINKKEDFIFYNWATKLKPKIIIMI